MSKNDERTCRGSITLGTACGSCRRCREEMAKVSDINWQKHPPGIGGPHDARPMYRKVIDLEEKVSALTRICGDKDIEIDRLNQVIAGLRKELSETRGPA